LPCAGKDWPVRCGSARHPGRGRPSSEGFALRALRSPPRGSYRAMSVASEGSSVLRWPDRQEFERADLMACGRTLVRDRGLGPNLPGDSPVEGTGPRSARSGSPFKETGPAAGLIPHARKQGRSPRPSPSQPFPQPPVMKARGATPGSVLARRRGGRGVRVGGPEGV
jgi:hypothetical protein